MRNRNRDRRLPRTLSHHLTNSSAWPKSRTRDYTGGKMSTLHIYRNITDAQILDYPTNALNYMNYRIVKNTFKF